MRIACLHATTTISQLTEFIYEQDVSAFLTQCCIAMNHPYNMGCQHNLCDTIHPIDHSKSFHIHHQATYSSNAEYILLFLQLSLQVCGASVLERVKSCSLQSMYLNDNTWLLGYKIPFSSNASMTYNCIQRVPTQV